MTESSDDRVGYATPPTKTRFKKGQSGNPKGRPKGSGTSPDMDELLRRELATTVRVERDGRHVTTTKQELLIHAIVALANGGHPRALSLVQEVMAREKENEARAAEQVRRGEDARRIVEERFQRLVDAGRSAEMQLRRLLREYGASDQLITAGMGSRGLTKSENEERRTRAKDHLRALGVPEALIAALDDPASSHAATWRPNADVAVSLDAPELSQSSWQPWPRKPAHDEATY